MMRVRHWLFLPAAATLSIALSACNPIGHIEQGKAAGSVEQQFDTRAADVSGDGDRARLSGMNHLNNPPWDLRSQPPAHAAGTQLVEGRWSGNGYADRVAHLALSVPGVSHSAAIASGRVILMGVGLRKAVHPNVTLIAREIRRRLITQAPEFRYVYVTANPRQVTEINQIADGLRQGHAFSDYMPRVKKLMSELKPVPLHTPSP